MPGRGPAPKPTASRERDLRRKTAGAVELNDDGQTRGPDLPADLEWPAATRDWWETWRNSPQAQTFVATDWSFLLDTAMLHAEYWLGDRSLAAELRLRMAKFGTTPEDRMRLRLSIKDAPVVDPAAPAQPRRSAARRSRLLKVVASGEVG